jgi:Holliday junction DNA helicase RuvB
MLFTDGIIAPFIIGGDPFTADAVDDLRGVLTETAHGDTAVTVNVVLPGEEHIPFHDAADLAPLYVPDWGSFVGQEQVKDMLRVHIDASVMRMEVLDHVLLASGMPGVGKTTLARLIAKELMSKLHMLVPPFTAQTLYEAAQRCGEGDVLFIDEIHKLADGGPRGAENLLHLLEERVLYIEGQVIPLQEFTVIGATTDKDKLPEPVLDRFQIKPEFRPYSLSEMVKIAVNFTRFYEIQLSPEIVVSIAKASRRTPRVARELVAGARDLVSARGRMCTPQELLAFKDITPDGLTRTHRAYLVALYRFFGRQRRDGGWEYIAGEASIANVLQENKSAVARLERYLIQNGLVDRTPSGRRLTDRGLARAREFAEQRAGTAVSY